jgi:hypothetical protein
VVVKLETMQKISVGQDETMAERLLLHLKKMNFEEADEILKSVEKLSDQEIEFMMN